ncbi:hypothetical protein EVAR_102774_1 [Eumeta japonica]|uniref:Uncharacterized protein n=1 Tax=Eumeta variegata TaxID=151549 RepID=A0A4C1THT9_EUMVA|nr:hypothetical protein EVAR_102774_1 [Eumeta japonica]
MKEGRADGKAEKVKNRNWPPELSLSGRIATPEAATLRPCSVKLYTKMEMPGRKAIVCDVSDDITDLAALHFTSFYTFNFDVSLSVLTKYSNASGPLPPAPFDPLQIINSVSWRYVQIIRRLKRATTNYKIITGIRRVPAGAKRAASIAGRGRTPRGTCSVLKSNLGAGNDIYRSCKRARDLEKTHGKYCTKLRFSGCDKNCSGCERET